MKTKKKNSLGKRILSTVLAIATALSGFTFSGVSNSVTADAESSTLTKTWSDFSELGDQIVAQALSYLGCGYTEAETYRTGKYTYNGYRYFDCSGLVYRVFNDIGLSTSTLYNTYSFRQAAKNHTVASNISSSNSNFKGVKYVSTITEYNNAVNNSANIGYLIVLDTAVSTTEICSLADLNPGTIIVTDIPSGGEAHAMIVIDQYESTSTSSSYATRFYEYYDTVMDSISSKYGLSLSNARIFAPSGISTSSATLTTSTTAAYNGAVYVSSDGYAMYSGSKSYYLAVNGSFVQNSSLGNTTWVVEASASGAGVRISNLVGAKSGQAVTAYLIGTPTTAYYAKVGIEKVKSTSTSTDVSGAVYAISDSLSTLKTLASNSYSSASAAKSAANSVSGVSAATTSSSGAVYFDVQEWEASEGQTKTFYIKEIYSPSGYKKETGYYTIKVKGTVNEDGKAATITSISSTSIVGSSYTLFSNNSTSGSYVKVADVQTTYYAKIGMRKVNSTDTSTVVSGAVYGLFTSSSTASAAATSTYSSASAAANAISAMGGSSLTTTSSTKYWGVQNWTGSSTKTYYVAEAYAPEGYYKDSTVYTITVTGTTTSTGIGCSISVSPSSGALSVSSSTSSGTYMIHKDTPHYYGALNLKKVDKDTTSTYVSGAAYVLIETGADISYYNYVNYATAAYEANSSSRTNALKAFYKTMASTTNKSGTATLDTYIRGVYVTSTSTSGVKLKELNSDGTVGDAVVLDFGTSSRKHYVLVEVYTPNTYELDGSYYDFYLQPNGNNSTTYSTALKATTMITSSSSSYAPNHSTSSSATNTWSAYASVSNNTSSASTYLTVKDEKVEYYAKVGIQKVKEGTSTLVSNAVYGLFASKDAAEDMAATTFTKTSAQGAAGAVGVSFTTSSSSTVWNTLSWTGSSSKTTYYLVEMYAPTGYERDTTVYTVTITGTKNTTGVGCSISVSPSGSNLTVASDTSSGTYMVHEESPATYYGAMNLIKKNESDEYVSGAVYALIMAGSGRSYGDYVELAQQAYESNKTDSAAAAVEFYRLMSQEYDTSNTSTLDSYIVGAYKTGTSTTGAQLKTFTASGIGSSSTVINFGSSTQKRFIMVEIWTPTGYTLDSKYYSFYLQSNENTSTTYSTAVAATTVNTSSELWHKADGETTTWDEDVEIINNDTTAALALEITDDKANYYGAMNLDKYDEDGNRVSGAVYVLIKAGAGIGYYNYVNMATAAYEANKTDSAAAFKAFYEAMQDYSGGDQTGYIVGAYKTSSSNAVKLKEVNSDGTISSSTAVLDFGTSSSAKYILVEVWTPSSYTLDGSYYAFRLQNNKNESDTYSTAVKNTTMITDPTSDYAPLHQSTGTTANSTNTWDEYATVTGDDSLTVNLVLGVTDKTAAYYGAMNFNKVSSEDDSTYVKGAVYALIQVGAGIDFYNYVDMATAAYKANTTDSDAAFKAFYEAMKDYSGTDLTGYIKGTYTTTGTSTAAELKAVNSDGTISSDSTVLDFGTKSSQKYVLVEVWTPDTYFLDDSYYGFYLENNYNESDDYETALTATTIITKDTATSTTSYPFHQTKGNRYNSEADTWDEYAVVSGNTTALELELTVSDDNVRYYGTMDLNKVSAEDGTTYVDGAVYALIQVGAGISFYNYVNMATAAYNANTTDSDAAFKAFYEAMRDYTDGDLTGYIVGAYVTTGTSTAAELKAVNSDGTISSDSTVLDFKTKSSQKYVLVEVWTPDDYVLDNSYYAFYLKNNGNTSAVYADALAATTMITKDTATSTTYYNFHQSLGTKYNSETDTWDEYAVISGNTTALDLELTVKDDHTRYYGTMNLEKKDDEGNTVEGAVYALIQVGAGISFYNYVDMAMAAYDANRTDGDAAFAAFYETMDEGGYASYIAGAYVTGKDAAELKAVEDGKITSDSIVLNFETRTSRKYILVEVYTPEGYTMDDSYYVFYLKNNGNSSAVYTDALTATTIITKDTATSTQTYNYHQSSKNVYDASLDTWDDYASISGNTTALELFLSVKDDDAAYYGAMNLEKKNVSGKYVSGAVYALIEADAGADYSDYLTWAADAYNANNTDSAAAFEAFYTSMKNYTGGDLTGYIAGAYTTGSGASELKAVNSDGSISSTSTVLDFGTSTQKKYVLVEVWTPTGYTLDGSYYAFCLQNYRNESDTYEDALLCTTMITDTYDASLAPLHQSAGTTADSTNTWDEYAAVTGGGSLTVSLVMGVTDEKASYYGALNLEKLAKNEGDDVEGAVYALIAIGSGYAYYSFVNFATTAYNANTTDSAAAFKAFYSTMDGMYNTSESAKLSSYIVGAYITTDGVSELKAVNSDGTISSDSTVIDFGTSTQKKYVLVEVWTPEGYELDSSYYAFYLQNNKNESDDYDDAVKATTMITDDSNTTYAPIHQTTGSTSTSKNTWDEYAEVTNGSSLTAALKLSVKDDEITTLTATKAFGTDTEDRITEVVVTLYQNGEATDNTLTLDSACSWTDTFTGLPKYDKNGDPYTYEAVETAVTYTDMYGVSRIVTDASIINKLFATSSETKNGTTTITNTFQYTQRAVIKVVDPDTESRLKTVVATLNADKKIIQTTGLTSAGGWYHEFTGLDKYSYTGEEIVYTVSEMMAVYENMDGNVVTVSGTALTTLFEPEADNNYDANTTKLTNTFQFTEHTVVKTFGDDTEDRITDITVELYRNGEATGRTATIDKASGWTYTWTGLDMYNAKGTAYEYTAVETGVTYTDMWGNTYEVNDSDVLDRLFNITSETKDTTTTITNTFAYTEHTAVKKFGDNTESRVGSVTAELYCNGEATGMYAALDSTSGWTYTWEGLDVYDGDGEEYTYSAVEVSVTYTDMLGNEYTVSRDEALKIFDISEDSDTDGTVITNTFVPVDVPVEKTFADDVTQNRVTEVIVTLIRNGSPTGKTVILNADGWTGTFKDLDRFDETGTEIEYTLEETSVTYVDILGKEHTITDTELIKTMFNTTGVASGDGTLVNDYEVVNHTVTKTFGDAETQNRVSTVTAELYINGEASGMTVKLESANGWTGTFENLDKYDENGKEIEYTAIETEVTYTDITGKEQTVSRDMALKIFTVSEDPDGTGTGTVITNTLNQVTLPVTKTFGDTVTESRVTEVAAELMINGSESGNTVTLNSGNGWTQTFEGLDMYDCNGQLFTYTAKETEVTYTDVNNSSQTVTTEKAMTIFATTGVTDENGNILNTLRTVEFPVKKAFGDTDTEEYIQSVTIALYANGDEIKTVTLDKTTGWEYSFKELDEYDVNAEKITYTAEEISVTYTNAAGETVTLDGDDIKNMFTVSSETDNGVYTVTNTLIQLYGGVTVEKVNSENEAVKIAGVEYGVYADEECTSLIETITTGADGVAAYAVATPWYKADAYTKTVYIKETKTVEPYIIDDTVYEVVITGSESGVLDSSCEVSAGGTDIGTEITGFTQTNTEQYGQIEVTKFGEAVTGFTPAEITYDNSLVSSYTNGTFEYTSVTMADAEFALYAAEDITNQAGTVIYAGDTLITTMTTGADGTLKFTDLPLGTYRIVETNAPEGQTIPEEHEWEVTLTYAGETQTITSESQSVYDYFTNATITVTKKAENGNALEDVYFGLYASADITDNAGEVIAADGTLISVLVTDENGYGEFQNAAGNPIDIPYGSYYIQEIQAGEGYVYSDEKYTFDFSFESQTTYEVSFESTFVNKEVRGIIGLEKHGEVLAAYDAETGVFQYTDAGLEGAVYEVYAVGDISVPDGSGELYYADGEYVGSITTDENGYGTLTDLPLGQYRIVETKAPDGYLISDAVQYATLEYAGQTVAIVYDSDGVENTFTNDRPTYDISITKYERNADGTTNYNTVLEGTGFSFITTTDIVNYNGEVIVTAGTVLANIETDTAGKAAVPTELNIPFGSYEFVETYVPAGYVLDTTPVTAVYGYVDQDTPVVTVSCEKANHYIRVEISKTDLTDGEDVPGATLTIYEVNEDGTRGDLVETWVTDGEPHTIERLEKGRYVLVEENTPDGYQVAEEVVFEVIENDEIQKVEMKDARTYGKVVVEKVDENGNPLSGATFTITNKDTGEVVDVITTDENGYAESMEMPIDERQADQTLKAITYTIQETATVDNYALDETVTEFEYTYADDTTPVVTYTLSVTNELQKGRIAVMKKGLAAVGSTMVETVYGDVEMLVYDYIYLPGVEFTIYADEDLTDVVAVVTTDKNGAAYSDYLPVGTYYIMETYTPAGYVADDTVYTVNISGDGTGNLYVLDVTKDIVNHPCSVTINIYKEGSFLVSTEAGYEEKTEPLEGVVIGIYASEDIANYIGDVVIEKDTLIAVLVTDENGLATMTETLPAGSYYYKELQALDGYVLDETEHEFSVSYDNDNATLDVNKENPLMNYIKSGTLTVNKVDQNGNPLGEGVEFLVTNVDTGETWTIVTDANGITTLSELSIGAYVDGTWVYYTYTLQETKTLDGYKLDDTVYTWKFTADNTNAEAVYQSFTVRNVILGIVDYSAAGGAGMLMLALVFVLMAIRKKKEEELETVTETSEE